MEQVKDFIKSHGYDFEPEIDGQYHEFKTEDGKGWYIGEANDGKVAFTFGDWKTSERFHFKHGFSEEDQASTREQQEQYKRAKEERQKIVALECEKDFEALQSIGMSPYLSQKGIGSLLGCKTQASSFGTADLIIPMYFEDKICNLQKIQEDGFKAFRPGGRTEGAYHVIGEIKDIIYITEGFATGASVHYATKSGVVVSFSASNLSAVAKTMRLKYPSLPIVIAADDDHSKSPNAGKESALKAAAYVAGTACFPDFGKNRTDTQTDWNDLHKARGLSEVSNQLKAHKAAPPPEGFKLSEPQEKTKEQIKEERKQSRKNSSTKAIQRWINGVNPLPRKIDSKGREISPTEFEVAQALFEYYEGRLVIQDGELFKYVGTHWKAISPDLESEFRLQLHVLYGGDSSQSTIKKAFDIFKDMTPKAPKNLYIPEPFKANFLNGTLHISDTEYTFEFLPHNPKDFLINVIPIEYDKTRKQRNIEFENMLDRILDQDPEKEAKIRSLKQMFGACVAPISPKLFMLHGPGGKGKSSLIMVAQKLVHADNWCSVEPKDFGNFDMESMAGKLVNIVTDISIREPIDDANIKKIEDRIPLRIRRKYQKDIYAPIPAVHIFAGNDIPGTYDRGSGAHDRRWIFLELNSFKLTGTQLTKDFPNKAFLTNPQGVLNFALEGLEDLLKSKLHYFHPESGKEQLRRWQMDNDPVALFIECVKIGELKDKVSWDENEKMVRGAIWDIFKKWHDDFLNRPCKMGRNKFIASLEKHSPKKGKILGEHFVWGFKASAAPY